MAANHNILAVLILAFLPFPPSVHACDIGDNAALSKIKSAFRNPRILSSWTNSTDCCNWPGVTCGNILRDRVTSLSLINNAGPLDGFSSPLPDALGDLPFLQYLIISNHPLIVGRLPSSLTRLTSLSLLMLRHNSLSGRIPSFLSRVRSLRVIDLAFNKFSGVVPPDLAALPLLYNLYLEGNHLVGGIPTAFGTFSKSTPLYLNMSYNMLSGEIPVGFGVPNWVMLDLSHNNLSGESDLFFGANKNLRYLDLSFNQFKFDLTSVNFPVNLTTLFLNDNSITGSIPAQINRVTHLGKFSVRNNELCGVIPAGPVMDLFDYAVFSGNKCLHRFW